MGTGQAAWDYGRFVACLLVAVTIHIAVARSFDLVGDVVPALALNAKSSGIFIIAIATELTAEVGCFFTAMFLPRIEKIHYRKRRVSKSPKNVQNSP